jgi:DNA ligase-associated metallophosphoesterase
VSGQRAVKARRLKPADNPCGSLWVELAGREVALRPSGALWLEDARTLIVSDLHLEKGSSYAARGQLLPPFDTRETLGRLERELAELAPRTLVLLGDSFHDRRSVERLDPADTLRIALLAQGRTLVWIIGNHDADGPGSLPGEVAEEVEIDGLTLRHEPRPYPAPGEVSGHLHPCAKVVTAGRGVRRRAFATDGQRLVLPAFGAYAGGLNVCDPAFAGLFAAPPLVGALGEGRVHPLPYSALCGD